MTYDDRYLRLQTRRQLFRDCGVGVGKVALASLLAGRGFGSTREPHFKPRIDRVI